MGRDMPCVQQAYCKSQNPRLKSGVCMAHIYILVLSRECVSRAHVARFPGPAAPGEKKWRANFQKI